MEKDPHASVLGQIETLHTVGTFTGLGDGQLLERFATLHGESAELAFAALVDRHGPMVVRVCRRILKNAEDTQDAFQATFLVLVRKGRMLRDRGSVGNWLYGVAFRVAIDARASSRRRQAHERLYAHGKHDEDLAPSDDLDRSDLASVLDEELARLPERYREPIVLCDLQNLTHEEAAHRLGWPVGTVRSRLSRGRERLRGRLVRRGLVLPAVGFLEAITEEALASVPKALADLTVRAAVRYAAPATRGTGTLIAAQVVKLTEGAIKSMFLTKLKTAALCLVVGGLLASGVGVVAYEAGSGQDEPRRVVAPEPSETKAQANETKAQANETEAQANTPFGEPVLNKLEGNPRLVSMLPGKTTVKKGQLICEFDSTELKNQLANLSIQVSVAESDYQAAKLTLELAEIVLTEFNQGIYPLEMQEIKGEVALAEASRKIAEAELQALSKAHKDTDLVVTRARLNLSRAAFAFEKAETKRQLLQQYTYARKLKEFKLNVEKTCADVLTNEMKFDLEKKKMETLNREIEFRKIRASADGVVLPSREIEVSSAVPRGLVLFYFAPAAQSNPPQ